MRHTGLEQALGDALDDEAPLLKRDGGFIRTGHHGELDEMQALRDESRARSIAGLQTRYADETGIKSLKIKPQQRAGLFRRGAGAATAAR